MDLVTAAALIGFMLSISLVFIRTVSVYGLTKAIITSMILADFFLIVFMLLGIDRPLFVVYTRLGSFTVTALMVFLLIKIPLTLYMVLKSKNMQQVLG